MTKDASLTALQIATKYAVGGPGARLAAEIRDAILAERSADGEKYRVTWNEAKTIGVIVKDDRDGDGEYAQLAYELRKGALNSLGVVSAEFVEAWAEMTADDNCTIQDVTLPRGAE